MPPGAAGWRGANTLALAIVLMIVASDRSRVSLALQSTWCNRTAATAGNRPHYGAPDPLASIGAALHRAGWLQSVTAVAAVAGRVQPSGNTQTLNWRGFPKGVTAVTAVTAWFTVHCHAVGLTAAKCATNRHRNCCASTAPAGAANAGRGGVARGIHPCAGHRPDDRCQ
jgi:hypothetical protein